MTPTETAIVFTAATDALVAVDIYTDWLHHPIARLRNLARRLKSRKVPR